MLFYKRKFFCLITLKVIVKITQSNSFIIIKKKFLLIKYLVNFSYDPTAVLDFLWALTCNPKLWQGREENTKNNNPDNILLLTKEQLLVLVMYLIEEAVILCERKSKKTAITQMETRLDLLISCCSSEDELIMGIVKYLADEMTSRNELVFA